MRQSKTLPKLVSVLVVALLAVGGMVLPISMVSVVSASPARIASPTDVKPVQPSTEFGMSAPDQFKGGSEPLYVTLDQKVSDPNQTPGNFLYYTPTDIRTAYNATSLYDAGYTGAGETIAIVDAFGDPYIQSELNTFSAEFGIPTTTVNQVCVDGPCNYTLGITEGWNTEIALDIEWSHAMAPGAAIYLYIGSNNAAPLYDAVEAAVLGTNGNGTTFPRPNIISMSWGAPENDFGDSAVAENYPFLDAVLQQGSALGITFFASTGDWGAYDQSYGQDSPYGGAIYPSTDPYVTAVGGTSLYLSTQSGYLEGPSFNATSTGYGYETAWSWNNVYGWSTGGGYSTLFGRPSWQSAPGLANNGERGAPDVAWDADVQTGVLVFVSGAFYIVGGTSVGSPSWAGSMALIDQAAGHNLGNINPALYSIANSPVEYANAFHDVTVGNNDPNSAGPGWDPLTGLGTPNLGELASYLTHGAAGLKVSVTSNAASGVGEGAGVNSLTISASVTLGDMTVTSGTVSATLEGPAGQTINVVPMTYNGISHLWTGVYTIGASDPPGMWTATVSASSGGHAGSGSATFTVGDGVNVFEPYSVIGPYLSATNTTIPISAWVTTPGGANVTTGSFTAYFFLGTPSGKVEGVVPLTYDPIQQMWVGSFNSSDFSNFGEMILSVNGTDTTGNLGAPGYSWFRYDLNILPGYVITDEPTYVSGDPIYIGAFVPPGTGGGTLYANVTDLTTNQFLGTVPLTYVGAEELYLGYFQTSSPGPTGFYQILVYGSQGGINGTGETVVRVAPLAMSVGASVSLPSLYASGTQTEYINARVSYPNSTLLSVGSVEAFVTLTLPNGTSVPEGDVPLTYNALTGNFTGYFPITQYYPDPHAASLHFDTVGNYSIAIEAYDPLGNYGQQLTGFTVNPTPTTTTVSCSSLTIVVNRDTPCVATVSDHFPSGNVTWSQSGPGTVTLLKSACTLSIGDCLVTVSGSTAGSGTLTANYSGDAVDAPSLGNLTLTVGYVSDSCTSTTVNVAATCTVVVGGPATPTGTVTWSTSGDGRFSSTTCALPSHPHGSQVAGECSVKYTPKSAGAVTITASWPGLSGNPPASHGSYVLSVMKKASKTIVSCTPTTDSVGGRTITCTAVVTGYLPGGTVSWSQLGTGSVSPSSTSCTLGATGRCSVTFTPTTTGSVSIKGLYDGDQNNLVSSGTKTVTIDP